MFRYCKEIDSWELSRRLSGGLAERRDEMGLLAIIPRDLDTRDDAVSEAGYFNLHASEH